MLAKLKQISESAYELTKALANAKLVQSDLDNFRSHVKESEIVPKNILDKQLLPFLIACENDSAKATKLIHAYYQIKKDAPEFFKNRDVNAEDVQTSLENQEFVILPTTPNNQNLILFRLKSFDPSDYDFDQTAKTYIMSFGTVMMRKRA